MRIFSKKRKVTEDTSNAIDLNGHTILIVDDSPTELHILKGYLEGAGCAVLEAHTGESGIETARSEKPDLILMDVVMPGLNGFQATRQLSRDPETAEIPIIMVTTKDQDTDKTWGIRQGAREYLIKPIEKNELLTKIKDAL